jgi:hypothetical protein
MGLRGWIRRAERAARGEMIAIPMKDGTTKYFTMRDYREAYSNAVRRLGAGEDAPPRHPMLDAAAASSDPAWRRSYFFDLDYEGATEEVEDLSEP